jgi:dienelactone hydrolase
MSAVDEGSLVGMFFQPAGSGARPAVLVLGGSEGGLPTATAALIASYGYAALALAYFGLPTLPPVLNVDVEISRQKKSR